MKRSIFIIKLLILSIFLANFSIASDAGDVKKVIKDFYKALNEADAHGYAKSILPQANWFPRNSGLLKPLIREAITSQDVQNRMQSVFDSGVKWNMTIQHLDVEVYGNSAVATYYVSGSLIFPNEDVSRGIFRVSAVCIKQVGDWKIVHLHISPLQTDQ